MERLPAPPRLFLTPVLPGDANEDGRVDINDLTIVLSHFGQTGAAWNQGESTGSGTVDINDLTIVLSHFGQSLGATAGGMAACAGTVGLAAGRCRAHRLAGLGLGGRNRRDPLLPFSPDSAILGGSGNRRNVSLWASGWSGAGGF